MIVRIIIYKQLIWLTFDQSNFPQIKPRNWRQNRWKIWSVLASFVQISSAKLQYEMIIWLMEYVYSITDTESGAAHFFVWQYLTCSCPLLSQIYDGICIFRGESFREDFRKLDGLRSLYPQALFLLLTATAPPAILKMTQDVLLLHDAQRTSAECGNQFSNRFDLTINSKVAMRISRLSWNDNESWPYRSRLDDIFKTRSLRERIEETLALSLALWEL